MSNTGPSVAVVGLGAIGGSVALALHARGVPVVATALSADDMGAAAGRGIEVADDAGAAVTRADIVVLAVPLDRIADVAATVVSAAPAGAAIFHVASLQRRAAFAASGRVIGTHPLAGSAGSGFAAADAGVFRGATVLVEARARARERADAELLWSLAGAGRVEYVDGETHDQWMAWASHLPQLAATALAATLAEWLPAAAPIGPGARDTTRLAASSLEMWLPILRRAPHDTVDALHALEQRLAALRAAIEQTRWDAVRAEWEAARDWRRGRDATGGPA